MNKSFLRFLITDNTKEITIMAFVKAKWNMYIQPRNTRSPYKPRGCTICNEVGRIFLNTATVLGKLGQVERGAV